MVVVAAPPNDAGHNRTGRDTTQNEKIVANKRRRRRLLRRGTLEVTEPVAHACGKVEKDGAFPARRLILHKPETLSQREHGSWLYT